jgi:caa(3)-type oxidase subunit IV
MSDPHTHPPTTPTPDASSHGDSGHGHGNYWHHVRPYLLVGVALFVFTVITVGLSYVDFDHMLGSHGMNMKVGLAVATFKVCLVGAFFMHLMTEKGTIWRPLGFTFFFCLGLFLLCLLAYSDPIQSTSHLLH